MGLAGKDVKHWRTSGTFGRTIERAEVDHHHHYHHSPLQWPHWKGSGRVGAAAAPFYSLAGDDSCRTPEEEAAVGAVAGGEAVAHTTKASLAKVVQQTPIVHSTDSCCCCCGCMR